MDSPPAPRSPSPVPRADLLVWYAVCSKVEGLGHKSVAAPNVCKHEHRARGRRHVAIQDLQPWPKGTKGSKPWQGTVSRCHGRVGVDIALGWIGVVVVSQRDEV